MFEWLEQEIASVKTPKFFCIQGPLPQEKRALVEHSDLAVPESYKQFVIRFGHAFLYRRKCRYLVEVYDVPKDYQSNEGDPLLHIGRSLDGRAYFKTSVLVPGAESPVFEWTGTGLIRKADGFQQWIGSECKAARRWFKKPQWAEIVAGPKPFSDYEEAIVEARRLYRWCVVGVAEDGNLRFEVHNGSVMRLQCLSVGVRGKVIGTGGVRLPVSHIGPGETDIVSVDCYKRFDDPKQVEVFQKPDPEPEDRECYCELSGNQ
jgi:hypothetical protein